MASPFSLMRRHQKVMLAIFGVICMIVFVIGDAVGTLTRFWANDGGDPKVVTWSQGSLTAHELESFRMKHNVTITFVADIVQKTKDKKGRPKIPDYREDREGRIVSIGLTRAQSDEDLLARLLLANKAQEIGIVINDEAMKDFLSKLSDNLLTTSEWEGILQEIIGSGKIQLTQHQVKDHLRLELAALCMIKLEQRGLISTSPISAWEHFNRFHHRRSLELLPLKVDDYKSQVKDEPKEQDIKELYEKYKDSYPFPSAPEPGFKQRKRIAFQYLKADFNEFVIAAMPSITDEEIQKEYDQSISRGEFKVLDLPPEKDEKKPETEKPDAEKPDDKKTDDPKPDDKKTDDAKPADPKKPAEKDAPGVKEKDRADDAPKSGDTKDCLAGDDEKDVPKKPPTGEAAKEKKSADPALTPPANEKPAAEKPGDDKPAEESAPDAKKAETVKPEPKFKPLAEVRDDIVKRLARKPAEDARTKAIEEARKEVDRFSRDYKRWEIFNDDKKFAKPKFDFPALAKKVNLIPGETELADAIDIANNELGKTSTFSFAGGQIATYSFGEIGYRESLQLYQPELIRGDGETEFLYWKVTEEAEYVPPLEKIRDKVLDAWKRREALKLAQKAAETKAKEAESKESLSAAFGDKVVTTPEFAWLSRGFSGFGPPQLSSVEGVDFPGPAFMEKVFSLKSDGVGVAENHPQSVVYVVRVAATSPRESLLREQFITSGIAETRMFARQESVQTAQGWYLDLIKELNVDWKRPPRSYDRNQE